MIFPQTDIYPLLPSYYSCSCGLTPYLFLLDCESECVSNKGLTVDDNENRAFLVNLSFRSYCFLFFFFVQSIFEKKFIVINFRMHHRLNSVSGRTRTRDHQKHPFEATTPAT